ncbi:tripartite tricarboxylate transporter substrate binding protein BugD [Plastoroseomonas hellenica]|uniref:Tripartite tricarboxylate transporter substrate binding protein BugD n=1 Tax=Plastoroseomonas hellenica TaxID=2687306 RepID=A0ABS5ERR5_9PROT|nr:tripartite tricarboxylate transporter substrate binding protein BugD [Plastoroseomonas hellenica]MBR0644170.1 tripartite tricarboxylate transporter substrate binding protein BugD [Plastoroseomonas hellenica]MBR0662990.1 tripartite tricarboxylate transporter substrate binding protein BugD [Plastoroseomonas hellenica]
MSPTRRLLGALALGALAAAPAAAQQYPTRPISIVVPFAAGGPTDTVSRLVAEVMGRDLGQNVVVENVGGAGGTLGANRVAQARPDGYTLLLHHIGMATTPALYRRLPYDPVNGFEPIGLITEVPMTLIARPDFPANTLAEAVAVMRQRRDQLNYANAGIGAASHLCGLLLMSRIEAAMTTVPFRGTGPAMQEILGGRVDLMCDQTTNTTEQIRARAVKVFAVTTRERVSALPDVPTAAEAGLQGLEVTIWHGLYAPRGTPAPVIQRLSQALQAALRDQRLITRFNELGTAPVAQDQATPAAHRAFWLAEIEKWRPLIQAAGQYAD